MTTCNYKDITEKMGRKYTALSIAKTKLANQLRTQLQLRIPNIVFYNMNFDISDYDDKEDTIVLLFDTDRELLIWEVGAIENISGFTFARYEQNLIVCENEDINQQKHSWWFESNPHSLNSQSRFKY